MKPVQIKDNIYWIGVNDTTTQFFEGIWPIGQEGISYNSYLIKDEKTAIIDLSKEIMTDQLVEQIRRISDFSKIDYVIMNHLEPDHSGAVQMIRRLAPQVAIYCTARAKTMLAAYFGIDENIHVIQGGDSLSLGKETLQFLPIPNVHWPETMATYATNARVLFTCDAFGGYGALKGTIFDDETLDLDYYKKESLRYYVNIVSLFNKPVLKAIETIEKSGLPFEIVAPSHGLVWRGSPQEIVSLYKRWAEYGNRDLPREKSITLVYGSMYGNTAKVMEAVVQGIHSENVPVNVFDVLKVHPGDIMPSIYTRQGLIIGAPTYEGSLYPPMANLLHKLAHKRVKGLSVAHFGSYGWANGAGRVINQITEGLEWEMLDTLEFNGGACHETLQKGFELGANFAKRIKA